MREVLAVDIKTYDPMYCIFLNKLNHSNGKKKNQRVLRVNHRGRNDKKGQQKGGFCCTIIEMVVIQTHTSVKMHRTVH